MTNVNPLPVAKTVISLHGYNGSYFVSQKTSTGRFGWYTFRYKNKFFLHPIFFDIEFTKNDKINMLITTR